MLLGRVLPGVPAPLTAIAALMGEAAVLAVVLVRGIRLSTRIALIVEAVSVALIVTLLTALLVQIGPFDVTAVIPTGGVSPSAVAAGAVLALTAFVGFESSATLGVEARAPLRNIPRAIVGTVLVAGALYLLAAYTQVAGFTAIGGDLVTSAAPIDELADAFGLAPWAAATDVGIAASFLACAIASTTALTRVLFAMGRDGVGPRFLGRTHPRHRTPIGAVWPTVGAIVVLPVVVVALGVRPWDAMGAVIVISAVGYIVAVRDRLRRGAGVPPPHRGDDDRGRRHRRHGRGRDRGMPRRLPRRRSAAGQPRGVDLAGPRRGRRQR